MNVDDVEDLVTCIQSVVLSASFKLSYPANTRSTCVTYVHHSGDSIDWSALIEYAYRMWYHEHGVPIIELHRDALFLTVYTDVNVGTVGIEVSDRMRDRDLG